MSHARGLLTPLLVTLVGVGTGIAIFDPAFKQEKEQKKQGQYVQSNPGPNKSTRSILNIFFNRIVEFQEQHAPSPKEQIRKTEEAVANAGGATTIPDDTERWSQVQTGQFSKPVDTFKWSEVPLDQYSTTEKSA